MNKEFRVWDAFQRKMSYADKNKDLTVAFTNGKLTEVSFDDNENSCGWSAVPIDLERANRYFAQQFTGLTDSSGHKIFEGDIVGHNQKKWEVVWNDGGFFEIKDGEYLWEVCNKMKVIGNIFETPELLKP